MNQLLNFYDFFPVIACSQTYIYSHFDTTTPFATLCIFFNQYFNVFYAFDVVMKYHTYLLLHPENTHLFTFYVPVMNPPYFLSNTSL